MKTSIKLYISTLFMLLMACNVKSEEFSSPVVTMHYDTNRVVEIYKEKNEWVIALTQNEDKNNTLIRVKVMASLPINPPNDLQIYNWFDCRYVKPEKSFNPMETPIIGLLDSDRKEGLIKPKRAWFVDYLQGTLVELDVNTVVCNYVRP